MKFHSKNIMLLQVVALAATLLGTGIAVAETTTVNLTARRTNMTLPDGKIVPMWGYCGGLDAATPVANIGTAAPVSCSGAWAPGPTITVAAGDALNINLTNNLPTPTSLWIQGMIGGGLGSPVYAPSPVVHAAQTVTTFPGVGAGTFTPPVQGQRVRSFVPEAAENVGTQSYSWNNLKPGTYLYQTATHPSIQAPMGLYGVLIVTDPAAYPGVAYDAETTLMYSEIDPAQNVAVDAVAATHCAAAPCAGTIDEDLYPPAVNYSPRYFLINGKAYDKGDPTKSVYSIADKVSSGNVLVRLVNAGLRSHIPAFVGLQMTLLAADGHISKGIPKVQNEVMLEAGKTREVVIKPARHSVSTVDIATTTTAAVGAGSTSVSVADTTGMVSGNTITIAGTTTTTSSNTATNLNTTTIAVLSAGSKSVNVADTTGMIANSSSITIIGNTTSASIYTTATTSVLTANSTSVAVADTTGMAVNKTIPNTINTITITDAGTGVVLTAFITGIVYDPQPTLSGLPSGTVTFDTTTTTDVPLGATVTTTATTANPTILTSAITGITADAVAPAGTVTFADAAPSAIDANATVSSTTTTTVTTTAATNFPAIIGVITQGAVSPAGTVAISATPVDFSAISGAAVTGVLVKPAGYNAATYALFDRQLSMSNNNAANGGMQAFLKIGTGGAAGLPAASVDVARAVDDSFAIPPDNAFNGNVIKNDHFITSVAVQSGASNGTLTLNSDGTFNYVPASGFIGMDSFTYNGSSGSLAVSNTATVTINISAAAALVAGNDNYTSKVATMFKLVRPGVLINDSEPNGYTLTAEANGILPTGVTLNADGSIVATRSAQNAASSIIFSYVAKNSLGAKSAPATVTVNFPVPSNLTLTVQDTQDPTITIADYRWVIEEDITYKNDPLNPVQANTNTVCTAAELAAWAASGKTTTCIPTPPQSLATNFHKSYMPVVATGCTGPKSCGHAQPETEQLPTFVKDAVLDPSMLALG